MKILAIETSCDETSAAVVKDGKRTLSNIVATQVEFHKKYGGIVPEVASRKHIEVINPIIKEALEKAKTKFKELDAVAVTYGPGLVGSLLVGLCAAKSIAYSLDIPLIGVNHHEAHIYANFLSSPPSVPLSISNGEGETRREGVRFPFVCLIVSGGHTMLVLVKDHGKYESLGRTRDDAAGEAFDKVARFLKLGYPGGPIIDKLAKEGNPKAISFTRPMLNQGFDFSFSGIKTAVVNYVNKQANRQTGKPVTDIAASFQQAVVDVLVEKTIRAAKENKCKTIALAGGVSANSQLREELTARCKKEKIKVHTPPLALCTDNAAMVGCAAFYHPLSVSPLIRGRKKEGVKLSPVASLRLV
ncbi:MAG: tRNA (adenosine(37)-N6)-threonylcarbamoyltransferase complex transferase subunit TsaD [Candidatus Margulisiibacteriota bacterium]|nr:tRNA (adenosine(37)-N6)-threonylcarbamoyltransferase complex transferase subunit TsaD [Candidatus Margulisiibacteriota bacterium]